MDAFQIYTIKGSRLWPLKIFDGEKELMDLDEIKAALVKNGEIRVLEIQRNGDIKGEEKILKKEDIGSIVGPIDYVIEGTMTLDDVLSVKEAAKVWELSDGNIVRKAIERGNFHEGEVRKSEATWLISYPAMQRLYEAVPPSKKDQYPKLQVHRIEFNFETGKPKKIELF